MTNPHEMTRLAAALKDLVVQIRVSAAQLGTSTEMLEGLVDGLEQEALAAEQRWEAQRGAR